MNIQKVLFYAAGAAVMIFPYIANAAKDNRAGLFIGLEGDFDRIKYTHYISKAAANSDSVQNATLAPYTSIGYNYSVFCL